MNGEKIKPVHLESWHPKAARAIYDVAACHGPGRGGSLSISIIFENEHDGQLPDRGEIKALQDAALIRTTIATERNRNSPVLQCLRREGGAYGKRDTRADYRNGSHHSFVEISDVHRTSFTLAQSVALSVDL